MPGKVLFLFFFAYFASTGESFDLNEYHGTTEESIINGNMNNLYDFVQVRSMHVL